MCDASFHMDMVSLKALDSSFHQYQELYENGWYVSTFFYLQWCCLVKLFVYPWSADFVL
jgi:hypothetical protein